MLISIRGVRVHVNPEKRLDIVVKEVVEHQLTEGNRVTLSTKDLVRMVRTGGYAVPRLVDTKDKRAVGRYCSSVLFNLNPNHGTVKREHMAYGGFCYEFIPDIPKQEV
jgi:hypothetical protein